MIAIIDYGAGNIKSLQFALTRLNLDSCLTTDQQTIQESDAVILPGVGAFGGAMETLKQQDLVEPIKETVQQGKPLLGICLGMQLLYDKSYEDGEWEGFGFFQGAVNRISDQVKVPHMGWNTLEHQNETALLKNIAENDYVYFVHSYAVTDYAARDLLSSANYGGTVPAIVQRENVYGMQFHPEKSGKTGLQLLQNFGELI